MKFDFDVEIPSDRWGLTFDGSVLTFRNFIIVQFKQKQVIKTQFHWNEEQLLSFLYLCDIIIWEKSIETGNSHFKSLSHSVMDLKLIEKHSYENKTFFFSIYFQSSKIKILIH